MSLQKPLFTPKPRFTPISADVDIPALVHSTPNFHWAHREDARLHTHPFHKLQQIIHSITIEQGLPIVVDNWHLRQDWNASLFSKEWLVREHGDDGTAIQDQTIIVVITVRDLVKKQDIIMSTATYLSQIPELAGQDFSSERTEIKEKPRRRHYGKDIDCPQQWRDALAQLLPREISYLGANDLMTKLPPAARAENMMIYIGHEGTYTPAHKDMCATYAQNIMVSTAHSPNGVEGLAYWFIFSARDRKRVADYWNTLGHDIDTEHFLASLDDLRGFPGNVWVVEQRVGDFVVIPPLGAHQVYNHGGTTIKAAWNRTTIDTLELSLSETLPAYRHVCRDEQYKNKAIVHQSLLELSRFPPQTLISSPFKHDSFMRLFRLYTTLLVDEFIPADYYRGIRMEKISQEFNVSCSFCRTNIWNRFLTCRQCLQLDADGDIDSYDICLECFSRGRSCRDITNLEWVQQEKWSDLMSLWERCRGIYQFLGGEDIDDFHTETTITLNRRTLAGVCVAELIRRPNPHNYQQVVQEGTCHTCKYRHPAWKMIYCTKEGCSRAYCFGNLFRQFDEDPFDILSIADRYICPVCRGICNCGACRKRKDQIGYEPKLRSVAINPKLVADKRSTESLVESNRTNTRWYLETKGSLSAKTPTNSQSQPEDSPPLTFSSPVAPKISDSVPAEPNLDPALLDPEMSTYFFGSQNEPDPPPYMEIEHSLKLPLRTPGEPTSRSPHFPYPFDTHFGQPLSTSLGPSLFGPEPLNIVAINHASFMDERPISISPALLKKSATAPVQEEVVWYSSGMEMQKGGKVPPLTKHGGKGKCAVHGGKGNLAPAKYPGKKKSVLSRIPRDSIPALKDGERPGKKYETIVTTGLDTFKRIRLTFRDGPPPVSNDSRLISSGLLEPNNVPPGSHSNPFRVDAESPHSSPPPAKKRDIVRREVPRITPPAALGVEGCRIPMASELDLDDNTPPPMVIPLTEKKRKTIVEVVVYERPVDKSLCRMFLEERLQNDDNLRCNGKENKGSTPLSNDS